MNSYFKTKGKTVTIKKSVSPTGEYGRYAGRTGEIIEVDGYTWGQSVSKIEMHCDGEILYDVDYSVLEIGPTLVDNPKEHFMNQIKALEEKIKKLNEKIELNKSKLEFVESYAVDTYDENEWKAFHILEIADDPDSSRYEQAKSIAKFIKESN